MRYLRPRSAFSWAVVAVLVLLVAVGTVVAAAGFSLWVLCFASLVALTFALAQHTSWTLAMMASLILPLWLLAVGIRFYPVAGVDLNTANIMILVTVALVAIVVLLVGRESLTLPPRPTIRTAALIAAPPALIGLVAVVVGATSEWSRISWAMNSDAIWNTVIARALYDDGGVVGASGGNAAPFTAALMAAAFAPGRVSATRILAHDVGREAELWVLAIMLVSALAGLAVARAVRDRRVLRIAGVLIAGLFVATWYVAGFAFQYGFYNVMPAVAVLLASWIVWTDAGRSPAIAAASQFLAATVLLATWAPLAAVPVVLGAMTLAMHTVPALRRRRRAAAIVVTIAGVVQFLLYAGLVSLADLGRGGGALSGTGAMAPVTPAILFVLAGALLCAAALQPPSPTDRGFAAGLVAACVSAVLAYGYLAWQLRGAAKMWGYYPAKFVWLVSIVLVILLIAASFRIIGRALHGSRAWLATLGVLVVIGGVVGGVPPSLNRLAGLLPVADIVREKGASARDAAAATLFDLSETDAPVMVARLSDDPGDDYFINLWLLQTQADGADDPVRSIAYYLNAGDPVQVCGAIAALGAGVAVQTSDTGLEAELRSRCGEDDFSVALVDRAGS